MNNFIKVPYSIGDMIYVFDNNEWRKHGGDHPEGNDIFYKKAMITAIKMHKSEPLADVVFLEDGRKSCGHFFTSILPLNQMKK